MLARVQMPTTMTTMRLTLSMPHSMTWSVMTSPVTTTSVMAMTMTMAMAMTMTM